MSTYTSPEQREAMAVAAGLADRREIGALIRAVLDPFAFEQLFAAVVPRIQARSTLTGLMGRPLFSPSLEEVASRFAGEFREAAADALARLKDQRAVAPLLGALSHQDRYVRALVANVLGRIGDRRAVSPLIAVLRDADARVLKSAAQALGEIGDSNARGSLVAMLTDKDEELRCCAAEALSCLEGTSQVAELDRALANKDLALIASAHRYFLANLRSADVPVLIDALQGHGTDRMAYAFLGGGHAELGAAGRKWQCAHRDIAIAM